MEYKDKSVETDTSIEKSAPENNPKSDTSVPSLLVTQCRFAPPSSTLSEQSGKQEINKTGLPDRLRAGIESLSGYSMDDVRVHYNSSKPAKLQAHAYAQGTNIHLAPGQERHLPHEAWHVVQQKQGRVRPTRQMKGEVNLNDDSSLEKEADIMGAKALEKQNNQDIAELKHQTPSMSPVQKVTFQKEFTGPALGTENELSSVYIFKTSSVQEIAVVRDDHDNDLVEITSDMVSQSVLATPSEDDRLGQITAVFEDYTPASEVDLGEQTISMPENLTSYTIELITHPALAIGQDDQLSEEAATAWELRRSAFDFALDCIITAGQASDLGDKHLAEVTKGNLKLVLRTDIPHVIQSSGTPSYSPSSFQATYSQASEDIAADKFLNATWLTADVNDKVGVLSDIEGYENIDQSKTAGFKKAVEYAARIIEKVVAINSEKPLVGIDPEGTHNIHDPDVKNAWGMLPRTLVKDTIKHILGTDQDSITAYDNFINAYKLKGDIEESIINKFIIGTTGFARTTLSDITSGGKGASAFEIRTGGDTMHPYAVPRVRAAIQKEVWGDVYSYPDLLLYKKDKPVGIGYLYWDTVASLIYYMRRRNQAGWYEYNPITRGQRQISDPRPGKTQKASDDLERFPPPDDISAILT